MSDIVVPQLGESVVEARVAKWLKKEGDRVEVGEPVVELETEKIDLEVSAERAGVLASIKRQEGEDVKIGELLAVIDESGGRCQRQGGRSACRQGRPATVPRRSSALTVAPQPADAPKATPTAKRMAKDHDVDLGSVQGSGTGGRVMKQDVQGALGAPRRGAGAGRAEAGGSSRCSRQSRRGARAPSGRRPAGERTEQRVRMTKRRADDRPPSRRGAAHGGDADDVQRDRHDGADVASRAAQGGVQEAAWRRPGHRLVLRQGQHRGAQAVPAAQCRDPGR